MPALPRSPLRNLSALFHRAAGWVLYHVGAHDSARRHFETVLEIRGDDFGAYVHLALVAYKLGDYAGWQRECGHARRTDPVRYGRLKHPFELFDGRHLDVVDGDGSLTPWRRAFLVSRVGTAPDHRADAQGSACPDDPCADRMTRRFGDDFSSDAERERFRTLAAIRAEDVRSTDVDALVRRLGS